MQAGDYSSADPAALEVFSGGIWNAMTNQQADTATSMTFGDGGAGFVPAVGQPWRVVSQLQSAIGPNVDFPASGVLI